MTATNESIKEAFNQIHDMVIKTEDIMILLDGYILLTDIAVDWLESHGLEIDDLFRYLTPGDKNDIH
jgi:hypothetical protein